MKPTASIRWLAEFIRLLQSVMADVEEPAVLEHDKPQTFLVELRFVSPIAPGSIAPIRDLLVLFAESNESHILSLDIRTGGMRFVLMVERLYNASIVNPLVQQPKRRRR